MLADIYLDKLFNKNKLSNTDVIWICQSVRKIFLEQPTLLDLKPPLTICGDTHGQFADTCHIFEQCGNPSEMNYLFLGDYVDRGPEGIKNVCILFLYKIIYPQNFFLVRGNHECANMTRKFGFYEECLKYHNKDVWIHFCEVFDCLPIAAIIKDKFFCVHGGISPELHSMNDIKNIRRPFDIPESGLICDLLWSDPSTTSENWKESDRGTGVLFGLNQILDFLKKFDFDFVCRAHQVSDRGFSFPFSEEVGLISLFSAPNYCGFENNGAAMFVDNDLNCTFITLEPVNELIAEEEEEEDKHENDFIESISMISRLYANVK